MLLEDLSIPVSHEKAVDAFAQIDVDGSGGIEFDEFKKWYLCDKEGGKAAKKASRVARLKMRAQKSRRDASGQTDLQFSRRALVNEAVKQSRAKLLSTYRALHPVIPGSCLTSAEQEQAVHHKGLLLEHHEGGDDRREELLAKVGSGSFHLFLNSTVLPLPVSSFVLKKEKN